MSPRFRGILFWLSVWFAASFFFIGLGMLNPANEKTAQLGRNGVVAEQTTVPVPIGAPAVWAALRTEASRPTTRAGRISTSCGTLERGGPRVQVVVDGRTETLDVSWRGPLQGEPERATGRRLEDLHLAEAQCPAGTWTDFEVRQYALRPGDRVYLTGDTRRTIILGDQAQHVADVAEGNERSGRAGWAALISGLLCGLGAWRLRRGRAA